MNSPNLTIVPTDFLERIEARLASLQKQIDGATITPAPEWLNVTDAAEKMGVNRSTIHNWAKAGKIEAKGSGKRRRVKIA